MARGYQSYRGRRSAGLRLLIVLLLLILLAACGFIFLQRYLSYTDDGGMYLDLPFARIDLPTPPLPEEPPEDAEDPENPPVNLVIDTPAVPEEPEPEDTPEEYSARQLVELAALPEDPAALTAELAAAGANGFVFQVRDDTGQLRYASAAASALPKAVAEGAADPAALTALCAAEDTVSVARFQVLRDNYYAFANMAESAVCQRNGYVWYDQRSGHWLDPDKAAARNYIATLAMECVQMGFDELLLEDLAYPSGGRQQKIDYSGNTLGKSEALSLLVSDLRTLLEPHGTRISLLLTEELLQTGRDEVSGQDLALLLPLVDAVYAAVADQAAAQSLLAAYGGENPPVLVPLAAEAAEGNWCILAG